MNEQEYLVLAATDDGLNIQWLEHSEVEQMLKDYADPGIASQTVFLEEWPQNKDHEYWNNFTIIIKGKIIAPKEVEVVKEYVIE